MDISLAKKLPCEQRGEPAQRPSSGQGKAAQSTWAKFWGVSSCRVLTKSWPAPAEVTPLSPLPPNGKDRRTSCYKWVLVQKLPVKRGSWNNESRIEEEASDLPGEKCQDVSVFICFMNLHNCLHCGLHIVWDRTENTAGWPVRAE